MKHLKFAIAIILLSLCPIISFASDGDENEPPKKVILTIGNNGTTPHRSLTDPIECYYQFGMLSFSTLENLGEAEIVVENAETGLTFEDTLSGIDATTIDITGASGLVLIYVTTDNASYQGEITL